MNRIFDLTVPMFFILLCIGCGIGWILWKKCSWEFKYWFIPVFVCYVLVLMKLTIFPIYIFDEETLAMIREGAGKYFVFYQVIPFASIKNYFQTETIIQLIGNVLLLSPFALFIEIFLHQRPKAWKVALAVSSASFLIEASQLSINLLTGHPSRVADVDDLILNTIGVVLTIILTRSIGKMPSIQKKLQPILYRQ